MSKHAEITSPTAEKFAVVIGIDAYEQGDRKRRGTNGDFIQYESLNGCVEDALEMDQYLLGPLGVKESHITRLLSPLNSAKENLQQRTSFEAPTYENIVKAIKSFTDPKVTESKSGDKILIHYSGHGARATTVFPDLKDDGDLDEALVPCDIINGGDYLRDLEFALLLRQIIDRGLVVTVVLDCCHSGSATRAGRGRRYRRIVDVYDSDPNVDRPPTYDDIVKTFPLKGAKHAVSKCLKSSDTGFWLQEPQGYALFAACRKSELAMEYAPEEYWRPRGALTYWLVNTLRHCAGISVSSNMLYRRVCAKIKDEGICQTPILAGDIHRLFFESGDVIPIPSIIITRVDDNKIELGQGRLHGVCIGSKYSIFPFTVVVRDAGALGRPSAMATVTSVEDLVASAELTFGDTEAESAAIESGCQAVLTSLPVAERVHFRLDFSDPMLHQKFAAAWETHSKQHPWLHLVSQNDNKAKYVITQNDKNELEIQGRHGDVKYENMRVLRPVRVEDKLQRACIELTRRIRHLAHFDRVQDLENSDNTCELRDGFKFELLGKCHSPEPSAMAIEPLQESVGGVFEIMDEDITVVRVKNTFESSINYAILSLQPLFGVEQPYPTSDFETLDPGEEKMIKFRTKIPQKLQSTASSIPVIDTLKVFVSTEAFSVLPLSLREIDRGQTRGSKVGNPFQSLLDKLGPVRMRNHDHVIEKWQTRSLRTRTLPKMSSVNHL